MNLDVRQLGLSDIEGVVGLQRACFPPPFPESLLWNSAHVLQHLERFPVGQLVAVSDGRVVGSATNVILSEECYQQHHSWDDTVGGHDLHAHDPEGTTLYGVDISVHPSCRAQGVARALYDRRFQLVRQLGLCRFATGCRIPDFAAWKHERRPEQPVLCAAEEYVGLVAGEHLTDRTLTPLLKIGLRLVCAQTNYMEDDESLDCAAILEWT